jgi:hypothetical protein
MQTHKRLISKVVLLVAVVALLGITWADSAEARHRRYEVRPKAKIVDDWGRCWARSSHVWWLTRCPGQPGAVVAGGVPLRWWWF